MKNKIVRIIAKRLYKFYNSSNIGLIKKFLLKLLIIYKRLFLKKIVITDFDSDIKLLLYPNSSAGQWEYFLFYDIYDDENFKFLKKFLKSGMVVVDVGANIGMYSLFFAKHVGENGCVISFEAYGETYKHFLHNCKLNNAKNIASYNLALSDKSENRLFYKDKINDGANSFVLQDNMSGSESITTVVFDEFWYEILSKRVSKIDLIKIDVEGWEKYVLQGMTKSLTQKSPIIIMEHNGFRYKESSLDAFKFLDKLGYSCWVLNDGKPIQLNESEINDNYNNVYIDFCYTKNSEIFVNLN